jgi:hypothetical protein
VVADMLAEAGIQAVAGIQEAEVILEEGATALSIQQLPITRAGTAIMLAHPAITPAPDRLIPMLRAMPRTIITRISMRGTTVRPTSPTNM